MRKSRLGLGLALSLNSFPHSQRPELAILRLKPIHGNRRISESASISASIRQTYRLSDYEDSKLLLHRFNWQRLWTTSPGKCITSICWRPDGIAIAVGLEDGTISLHDVEKGKLLRSMKFHCASVVCLNWEEDRKKTTDGNNGNSTYEDRTAHFFSPAPRVPRTAGLVPGDSSGFTDIYFNIFGIFPIGKVNIRDITSGSPLVGNHASFRLMDASISKMALSSDICHITVLCSGVLTEAGSEASDNQLSGCHLDGFHCLVLDSTMFQKRKNELRQVAQQASNVEHLIEVIRKSIAIMVRCNAHIP